MYITRKYYDVLTGTGRKTKGNHEKGASRTHKDEPNLTAKTRIRQTLPQKNLKFHGDVNFDASLLLDEAGDGCKDHIQGAYAHAF